MLTAKNVTAKKFCKEYNMKFEKSTNFGFIASFLVPIRAGKKHKGIKTIGKKRVFFDMYLDNNCDVPYFGKKYNWNHPKLKK